MRTIALVVAALTACPAIAHANDGAGSWAAVIRRDVPSVGASASAWVTTVVSARASREVVTGSIARRDAQAARTLPGPRLNGTPHALNGIASFYWQDQMTATGERFDKRAMTAAHRTLPFGTRVKVTRVDTGSSVVVRINDRGPFKESRVIDLSEKAAEDLGMTGRGLSPVRLEILAPER
ncbi:MAG: septal ring lytic transglycosylase RlpA family protein [Hyphomicrobium sp.]